MGKRYHCDYCDKTMSSAPAMVKVHNSGLVHQKILKEHYQIFKDPESILAEERNKKPCSRLSSGNCQFGFLCRFSHYSRQEIAALENIVALKKSNTTQIAQPSFQDLYQELQRKKTTSQDNDDQTTVYDNRGVTHILPWSYNSSLDNYTDLPPSLKRLKLEDFETSNIVGWG